MNQTILKLTKALMANEDEFSIGGYKTLKMINTEAERLMRVESRYEKIRKLTPRAFADLYERNLHGMGNFDGLVDLLDR